MSQSRESWETEIGKAVRVGQIIVSAVTAGPLVFLAIAVGLRVSQQTLSDQNPSVFTWLSLGFAAAAVLMRMIVPALVFAAARRRIAENTFSPPASQSPFTDLVAQTGDAGLLWMARITKTILAVAILEGAAFFAIIAFMIEGSLLTVVVALLLTFAILLHMPTQDRVACWIDRELANLANERSFGR